MTSGRGALGIKLGGKMFAMFHKSQLLVKLDPERVAEVIASGDGLPHDPGTGTPMKNRVRIPDTKRSLWIAYCEESRRYEAGTAGVDAARRRAGSAQPSCAARSLGEEGSPDGQRGEQRARQAERQERAAYAPHRSPPRTAPLRSPEPASGLPEASALIGPTHTTSNDRRRFGASARRCPRPRRHVRYDAAQVVRR